MGSGSSAPPSSTQTTTEPPSFARPGLKIAADAAVERFEGAPPQFFPGSTVVPFAPETEEALGLISERARAGSPLVRGAQQTALETIQGRGVNPFLGEAVAAANAPLFERFSQETLPGLRSSFAKLGRSGSGAEQGALNRAVAAFGRGTAEQASQLAFGSAEAEAARQQEALRIAPGLAAQDFVGAERLAEIGGVREGLSAIQLQEQIDRFNFAQNIESARINELISQLTGASGNLGTVTQPGARRVKGPSKTATGAVGALGGAAAGATIGAQFGTAANPGIGTAVGAVGGGILGLIGGLA